MSRKIARENATAILLSGIPQCAEWLTVPESQISLNLAAPSERHLARCRAGDHRNFLCDFNSSGDGARNVRG
jgi:hypothetical protein